MIIRPAKAADIDGMVELLHSHMNRKFSRERWRQLFTYPWCRDKPDFGRVAIDDDGEMVGCVAAVYSDRLIDGRMQRVVNPAAWYLKKKARKEAVGLGAGVGLGLMEDLTGNPEWHYVISTSSKLTVRLLRRIGFTVLDDAKYVWRWRYDATRGAPLKAVTDRSAIFAAVSDDERRILSDHESLPITPIVFRADNQTVLIIVAETIKGADERWSDILYVSNPAFMGRYGDRVADALLSAPHMILAADCRFCASMPEGAERIPLEVARYAKSSALTGHRLDHLYSEIQLLDQKLR